IALTRDQFSASHIGPLKAIYAELRRMRERASNWSRAPELNSMWNNRAWKSVHDGMFNPAYPIGQCIALIAKGDDERLQQAYVEASKKLQKPSVTLEELAKKLKARGRPDGKPRVW